MSFFSPGAGRGYFWSGLASALKDINDTDKLKAKQQLELELLDQRYKKMGEIKDKQFENNMKLLERKNQMMNDINSFANKIKEKQVNLQEADNFINMMKLRLDTLKAAAGFNENIVKTDDLEKSLEELRNFSEQIKLYSGYKSPDKQIKSNTIQRTTEFRKQPNKLIIKSQ